MTVGDIGESLRCRAAWSSTSLSSSTPLSEPSSCEGRRKRSWNNSLSETMSAVTAPCANINTTGTTVAQTAWQKQESSQELHAWESDRRKSMNGDVGQNTILEKTHEFFQMCDIDNKGFITRRDMQVRAVIKGLRKWSCRFQIILKDMHWIILFLLK